MSDTARKRPTSADLEALPPHLQGEILGGELVVSPRPAPRKCARPLHSAVVQAEPFDALPLKLSRLWGRRKPPQQVTPG